MFAVDLLENSAVASNCYIVLDMPSVFTFHISLEVLYYNYHWSCRNLLTVWKANNSKLNYVYV